jgi:CheY-like chemotaxis protein
MSGLRNSGLANNLRWVKDGQEALDFLFRKGDYAGLGDAVPSLVLLDVHLPKVSGVEVLKAIKADASTRRIPVVMLTSSTDEREMAESYRLGVNSYMVKPIDFKAFAEIVHRAGYYWVAVDIRSTA